MYHRRKAIHITKERLLMYQVKVEDDYSIVIPEEIVKELALKEGDIVDVTIENGYIIISPVKNTTPRE